MILSDEDKEGLTPDEIRALEQAEEGEGEGLLKVDGQAVGATAAEQALEQEDKGKQTEQAQQQAAAPAPAPAAAQAGQEGNEEGEGEGDDDKPAATSAPAPAPVPTEFKVEERDFAAELKAVRAERSEIEKQWSDGDLSDEQRLAKLEELEERRDSLLIEQTRAQTLTDINRQTTAQQAQAQASAEDAAILALVKADSVAGQASVSYKTDVTAQQDFDAALAAAKASASHAGKSPAEIVQVAHNMVLSMRGISPVSAAPAPTPAPTPAPAPAPAAKSQRREVPPSLGGLPDAGRSAGSVSDENWARFSNLNGEAAERFLAGLPESEVDRLTRMADSKMFTA